MTTLRVWARRRTTLVYHHRLPIGCFEVGP